MSVDAAALKIIEDALAIDDRAERAAFVRKRCGGDAVLGARVEALLARDPDSFRLLSTESFLPPLAVVDDIPEQVGPYRVTGEIARGGMGAVVRAERSDGVFAQTVAIKLIRRDLAGERARRRFEEERRILARLRHPGIVRIVDGGETGGRPWLAMDYVDGLPITEALAVAGVDARLAAFEAVCEAVAFAHRAFVVHADIKPSNVLMSADGTVSLLDFGIARLIVALDEAESGDPYPLTKGYAAPERAVGALPTVASDVFSLGVLLLGVLGKDIPGDDRVFVPGTRLPVGQLDGDLGAIAARALAEVPEDRYPDVPALLADIRRHRAAEPVSVRAGEGWRYRGGRFVRRHRRGLALAGAVALGLIAATAVSTMEYARAERARGEADRRFGELRRLADFMLTELTDRLSDAPGTVPARARLAEVAGHYLDRLRAVPGAPADLRLDTARGYRRLAALQGLSGVASLGRPADAARSLDRADAILASLPPDAAVMEERGWIEAGRWTLQPDTPVSKARNAAACAWFARALAAEPARQGARLGAIRCVKDRAYDLIWAADKPADAVPVLRGAIDRLHTTPFDAAHRREAALLEVNLLGRLGDAIYYAGDKPGALAPYRAQEGLVRRWLAGGMSPVWVDKLGEAAFNISGTLGELPGHAAEASAEAGAGVAAVRAVLAFGPDANLEKRLLILLGQQALMLGETGHVAAAAAVSDEGLALRRRRLAAAPGDPQRRRDLAVALPNHALILAKAGRPDACAVAREGVTLWQAIRTAGALSARDAANDMPLAARTAREICG